MLVAAASSTGAALEAHAGGAHAHLVDRLLARDVGHARAAGEASDELQEEGRLADAGVAADEHGRGRHEAAARDAVELDDAAHAPRNPRCGAVEALEGERLALARVEAAGTGLARLLLDDAVPGPTRLAAALPASVAGTAFLTDEAALRLRHLGASLRVPCEGHPHARISILIGPSARPWMNWST